MATAFVVDGLRESCLLFADTSPALVFSISLHSKLRLCQGDVCTSLFRCQTPVCNDFISFDVVLSASSPCCRMRFVFRGLEWL